MGFFWRHAASKRISQLEDDFAKLKRDIGNLELEWTNFYDKARRMLARVAKRAEVVERADAAATEAEAGPIVVETAFSGHLTDHQKKIQQQILRRRAGG